MKKLPVLAINIDGVIRNFLDSFDRHYRKVFIYNPGLMKTDGDQVVEETEEDIRDREEMIKLKEKELISLPVNSPDLLNHYKFEGKIIKMNDETKLSGMVHNDIGIVEDQSDIVITPQDALNNFIQNDYTYQILGAAEEYQGASEAINRIQLFGLQNNLFETVLVSLDKHKAIAATYSFLGKCNCRVKKVFFLNSEDDKWNIADAVVDVTPEVFQSRPDDKVSIKVKHGFNIYDNATFEINNIKELYNERLLRQIFSDKNKQ